MAGVCDARRNAAKRAAIQTPVENRQKSQTKAMEHSYVGHIQGRLGRLCRGEDRRRRNAYRPRKDRQGTIIGRAIAIPRQANNPSRAVARWRPCLSAILLHAEAMRWARFLSAWIRLFGVRTMDKSIELPIGDCALTIRVERDGTWLNFRSSSGVYTSICIEAFAGGHGTVIKKGLLSWCDDRRERAQQIRDDNGQFGVGA